jgi:hypothetical protein
LREPVERKSSKRRPVADYIKERDRSNRIDNPNEEPEWENWLQDWRVELNAMSTAEFVEWMEEQFRKHHAKKVIPSEDLTLAEVSEQIAAVLLEGATTEVEEEHYEELEELLTQLENLETEIAEEAQERADQRYAEVKLPTGAEAVAAVEDWLADNIESHWRSSLEEVAKGYIPDLE